MNRVGKFLQRNLEEIWLVGALAEISVKQISAVTTEDEVLLNAIKRSTNQLDEMASTEEVLKYLQQYDEEQIPGLVSNIKGVYHELHYAKIENEDGDAISAELYEDTNHEGYDIKLKNEETGEVEDVQLKATDDKSYVESWIEEHGNGEQILVTEEVAEKMGLKTTGVNNEELTTNTEDFISRAMEMDEGSLTDTVPYLSVLSVSIIIYQLFRKYKRDEITLGEFKVYAVLLSGKKIIKIGFLLVVLSIPIIGQVTGAYLVYSMLKEGKKLYAKKF